MDNLHEFERACRSAGIPTDRVELVKRNIELKTKLNSALRSISDIRDSLHQAYEHSGNASDCTRATCVGISRVLVLLNP